MPELPEVETVCRGLEMTIIGKTFESVWVGKKKLRQPIPKNIEEMLVGRRIESIFRRAKYVLIRLSASKPVVEAAAGGESARRSKATTPRSEGEAVAGGESPFSLVLIIHLGMSGQLVVLNAERERGKHDHFIAKLCTHNPGSALGEYSPEEKEFWLYYTDPRRFGLIDVIKESELATHALFKNLGPEPFAEEFNAMYLQSVMARRSQNIKVTIMDQAVVVGVGNIYASEALFRSSINPEIPANKLALPKLQIFVKNIREVLAAAIESGGSTLRDYVRSTGDAGYFQHNFDVYGRDGKPCNKCKTPIKKITQGGRSTFYCPKCQKV